MFNRISQWVWEIPVTFRKGMRVPGRIYASESLLKDISRDRSLEQLVNITFLPGIEKYGLVMPDCHEGYASPIGGVAAIRAEDGIISPGMQGYDINCGIKVLVSNLRKEEVEKDLERLAIEIQKEVPSGLGSNRKKNLSFSEIDQILENGLKYLLKKGRAEQEDLENCEARGMLEYADADTVSRVAKERGRDQVGTLGSGNHFLEIQFVDEVFDSRFGLFKDQVVIMIHCGSRGLGHQVCTDYLKEFIPLMERRYKISVPDREFACVPFKSSEGSRCFFASGAAANYAWVNRQEIAFSIKEAWQRILKKGKLTSFYDLAHNIIKRETHIINGKPIDLLVHRKGATRSLPPKNPEVPPSYRELGQPVIIPGSMGTSSYILRGTETAAESFYSTCHGSGRAMSRHQAVNSISGQEVIKTLESKGIIIKCYSLRGMAEEAPDAYKDIEEVINTVSGAGLSLRVARLKPLAVIKGE